MRHWTDMVLAWHKWWLDYIHINMKYITSSIYSNSSIIFHPLILQKHLWKPLKESTSPRPALDLCCATDRITNLRLYNCYTIEQQKHIFVLADRLRLQIYIYKATVWAADVALSYYPKSFFSIYKVFSVLLFPLTF